VLLVIDHRDSFTWNLAHALERWIEPVEVVDSAEITVEYVQRLKPIGIVISPGPGRPEEASATLALVRALGPTLPMLGVCLGHQILCSSFGAQVRHAPSVFHGRVSRIHHCGDGLFTRVPSPFTVARYHSLLVDEATLPPELIATAHAETGELMAVAHRSLPLFGVQFHPESFLTEHGGELLRAFAAVLPATSRTTEARGSARERSSEAW
jgi:anthranilate synthase/aminodeoxychorismate synthase-like glutamine amidotransferase